MKKNRLFTPGPTMVPEEILLEMARPMEHYRSATWPRKIAFRYFVVHTKWYLMSKRVCAAAR